MERVGCVGAGVSTKPNEQLELDFGEKKSPGPFVFSPHPLLFSDQGHRLIVYLEMAMVFILHVQSSDTRD